MISENLNNTTKGKDIVKVMVVDDSAVIRGLFCSLLDSDPNIEVVATAGTGAMAIHTLERQGKNKIEVDVITLDIQMPEMDGLTALPKILEISPHSKVIMASTIAKESAEETMKALELGATECLAKPDTSSGREAMHMFTRELLEKVRVLGGVAKEESENNISVSDALKSKIEQIPVTAKSSGEITLRSKNLVRKPGVIAIGSSTGGPQALLKLFSALKGKKFNVPVFITQHMPPQFTALLAKQISDTSGMECKEAEDGEEPKIGNIYIAPGDYHMLIKKNGESITLKIDHGEPENFCRPAVDPMLRSIAEVYRPEKTLVLILTGMGSDGFLGCKTIVENGGSVLAQDEKTSVVWGMPGAVATGGLCMEVLPLEKIPDGLIEFSQGQIQ